MITNEMIENGAAELRERQARSPKLRQWVELPDSTKRKWREHAEAVLRAALGEPE